MTIMDDSDYVYISGGGGDDVNYYCNNVTQTNHRENEQLPCFLNDNVKDIPVPINENEPRLLRIEYLVEANKNHLSQISKSHINVQKQQRKFAKQSKILQAIVALLGFMVFILLIITCSRSSSTKLVIEKPPRNLHVYKNCQSVLDEDPSMRSGYYFIFTSDFQPLTVWCEMINQQGWIVIQRRGQFGNPKDYFQRNWIDYESGFGDIGKEFWLGLKNIHNLLNKENHQLKIRLMEVGSNRNVSTIYSSFKLSGPPFYNIYLSQGRGSAGDPLSQYNGTGFSTPDEDNDSSKDGNCARKYKSGWWFSKCGKSNLNGFNYNSKNAPKSMGITFCDHYEQEYSFQAAEMMIRVDKIIR